MRDLDDLIEHADMERKRKREDAMFPDMNIASLESKAAAWDKIVEALTRLTGGEEWLHNGHNGTQCAINAIEGFAKSKPQPEATRTNDRASKIAAFKNLPANWDSYGAEAFTEKTIKIALEVSAQIAPDWKVVPCADGPSVYFWRDDDREQIQVLALDEDQSPPQKSE